MEQTTSVTGANCCAESVTRLKSSARQRNFGHAGGGTSKTTATARLDSSGEIDPNSCYSGPLNRIEVSGSDAKILSS